MRVTSYSSGRFYLGCQVVPGGDVFVNTVGTFGIASASYYWSRVAAAVGRLSQYLAGYTATSRHILVTDDYLQKCGGPEYRCGLRHKRCGGLELMLRSRCIGISSRSAEWWTEKIASSATVHMASFEEGLGRIMFVAGALEHERPFLGPLYKFIAMHPKNAVRRIASYVSLILRYLSAEIAKKRHFSCGTKITTAECTPRVDA